MIERSWVQAVAGAAGDFSSPWSVSLLTLILVSVPPDVTVVAC